MINADKLQTYRSPRSIQEAADMIKRLSLESQDRNRTVYRLQMDDIKARFEVGRLLEQAFLINASSQNKGTHHEAVYAHGLADDIAAKAEIHLKTLRDCHAVYKRAGTRERFFEQLQRWEDQNIRITWNLVKNWGWKRLPEDKEKAQKKIDDGFKSLERRMRKAKDDLLDMREQIDEWEPERRDELLGVAQALVETIEEVQVVKVEGVSLERPTRTLDRSYLAYVRSRSCANCGTSGPSEPHHVDRGGTGTKGSDRWCVSLCPDCHRQIHDVGRETFWNGYNVWKIVAQTLDDYIEYYVSTLPPDEAPFDIEYDD